MAVTVEAKEATGLEPGAYEGTIIDLIEETKDFGEGLVDQIKLVIEVDDLLGPSGAVLQWAYASRTLSPKSKLWKWIKQVSGQTPQIGASIPIDELLVNQHIGFLVSMNKNDRPTVTDIFAKKAKATAAAPSAPAPATAPKQNAVAERLQAQPPAPAAVDDTVCCVPKCGRAVDVYDADGNAFCVKHRPDDES